MIPHPRRPLHTYPLEPMIDWHDRCEMAFAAAGQWIEAQRHAIMAERLATIDRLAHAVTAAR